MHSIHWKEKKVQRRQIFLLLNKYGWGFKKNQISFGHDWIDFWWWLWKKALKCILGKCITHSKTNVFFFLETGEILSCGITLSKNVNLPTVFPTIGKRKANQTLILLIGRLIMIIIKSQIHFLLSNHYWWTLDNKWFRQISISPTSYNHYLPAYCLLREVGSQSQPTKTILQMHKLCCKHRIGVSDKIFEPNRYLFDLRTTQITDIMETNQIKIIGERLKKKDKK